jgi:hypothetical protein
MAGGRPTDYDAELHCQLAKWHARWGKTDTYIAEDFGITEKTLNNWKKKYPEFLQSISTSKNFWDSRVEDALLKVCMEQELEETEITYKPEKSKKEDGASKAEKIRRTKKKLPPQAQACLTWLRIRQPEMWREVADDNGAGGYSAEDLINIALALKQQQLG